MPAKRIDFNSARQIALALRGVEESVIHGAPSLKVSGKLLACPAIHSSAEPNTMVVQVGFDQRAKLMTSEPDVYYVTDHYVGHPMVLVRLSRIDRAALRNLLKIAWETLNSKPKANRQKARGQAAND